MLGAFLLALFEPSASAGELKPFGTKSVGTIRQAHKERPFILAFWSLTCAPCREEMALLKTMHAKYPAIGIVLVGTDPPSERAAVIRFLLEQNLGRIEQWGFADAFEERIRYSVDPDWRGELPRTYLYDADHRVTVRSGVLDRKALEAWLERVTKRRSGAPSK